MDPENIRFILAAGKHHKTSTVAQIRKWLCNEAGYSFEEATELLLQAVLDGFLIPSSVELLERIQESCVLKDNITLNITDLDCLSQHIEDRDPYCYECHKPSDLQNCSNCFRTFHSDCQRKDIFLANGTNKIKLKDHVPIETFLSDDISDMNSSSNRDHELELENVRSLTSTDEAMIEDFPIVVAESPSKLKEESFESEKTEEKTDVIYMGQIREPNRKRANNLNESYKNEITNNDEEDDANMSKDDDTALCTNCKLMKKSATIDPGNITNEETCYLLNFVFNRIASWIPLDTFSILPKSKSFYPPTKDILNYIKIYCFKYPMTLDAIEQKILNKEYKSFSEFYVDFLDIQHCVGIVYGLISEEYLATEYQIKDCGYELSEIRQCRDCYRRSNDKNYIKDWFCIPCVPRHELVYAKKTPWPYWPAKVMKFKDNKYDVRFFSDRHERAIIDAKYIKPIEVYNPPKTSSALRKAMQELEKYQVYDQQPVGTFSFENERVRIRTITPITNLQNKSLDVSTKLRPKKSTGNAVTSVANKAKESADDSNGSSIELNQIPSSSKATSKTRSGSAVRNIIKVTNKRKSNGRNPNEDFFDVVKSLGSKIEKITDKNEIKDVVMETMQNELKVLRDKIDELKTQIVDAKMNQWCKWCLQLATLNCCDSNAYCSVQCQKLDWRNGHEQACSRNRGPKSMDLTNQLGIN